MKYTAVQYFTYIYDIRSESYQFDASKQVARCFTFFATEIEVHEAETSIDSRRGHCVLQFFSW